jgi:hypothetical protein
MDLKSAPPKKTHSVVYRWLAMFLTLGAASWFAWCRWDRTAKLPPAGGLYFPGKLQLKVPVFAQADARWRGDLLGPTSNTLGAEGCAVTSAAMVLAFHGMNVDPQRLNHFLTQSNGYTERGWLHWEAAAEYEQGKVRHAYEDLPSYRLIDWNLLKGNPLIVRIRRIQGPADASFASVNSTVTWRRSAFTSGYRSIRHSAPCRICEGPAPRSYLSV